jgi:pimeloyl-ACP methyl ester carboxylesterase
MTTTTVVLLPGLLCDAAAWEEQRAALSKFARCVVPGYGMLASQINALLGRPDARAVFAAVQCPTLILCGRQDPWSPLSRHERMQRALPHARLVVIEDSGHMTTMEQPGAVSKALLEWLSVVRI